MGTSIFLNFVFLVVATVVAVFGACRLVQKVRRSWWPIIAMNLQRRKILGMLSSDDGERIMGELAKAIRLFRYFTAKEEEIGLRLKAMDRILGRRSLVGEALSQVEQKRKVVAGYQKTAHDKAAEARAVLHTHEACIVANRARSDTLIQQEVSAVSEDIQRTVVLLERSRTDLDKKVKEESEYTRAFFKK